MGVVDWLEYPLEGDARCCSNGVEEAACWGMRINLRPTISEPGDPGVRTWAWEGLGFGGRHLG